MSTPDDPHELLRRIEQLEARLGRELDAERLIIRGRGGRPVIEMAASPDGEPEIVLSDATGRERILVRLVDDECALEFLDGDGGTRLRVASSDRTTRVVLWPTPDGARRLELRVAADGTALLAVPDAEGAMRVSLGVDGSGSAIFSIAPPPQAPPSAPHADEASS